MTDTDQPGAADDEPPVPPTAANRCAGPSGGGPSRRWLLAGGIALAVGAGAGVAGAFASGRRTPATPRPAPPPAVLLAAIRTERALIADLDATTGGTPAVRTVLVQARADHAAHLRTLTGLLATYPRLALTPGSTSPGSTSPGSTPPGSTPPVTTLRGTPRTDRELRAAELSAARTAAHNALTARGPLAALLASISACEQTHAELLT